MVWQGAAAQVVAGKRNLHDRDFDVGDGWKLITRLGRHCLSHETLVRKPNESCSKSLPQPMIWARVYSSEERCSGYECTQDEQDAMGNLCNALGIFAFGWATVILGIVGASLGCKVNMNDEAKAGRRRWWWGRRCCNESWRAGCLNELGLEVLLFGPGSGCALPAFLANLPKKGMAMLSFGCRAQARASTVTDHNEAAVCINS
ncbi:unnamed protein product [Effrenium voratum]|nr:unnamed protein product [Effrenium voratum]